MKIIHDNNKKTTPPVQLPLLELGSPSASEAAKSGRRFWYITRWRNSEMLVDYDHDGGCQWLDHDTRFVTPHLFNSHQAAKKIASRNNWQVASWPYSEVRR